MNTNKSLGLAVIITLLGIAIFVLHSCQESVETTKPEYRDMIISVYASLLVVPEDNHKVYAEVSGLIREILVGEGDAVRKSQVIARIEANQDSYNFETASLQEQLAEENLKGPASQLDVLENEIQALKVQLANDSVQYYRQEKLWKQNIGSRNEYENRKLKYELTLENLSALRKKYSSLQQELENIYKQSKVRLSQAQSQLEDYDIKADIDGRIYSIYKEEGELLSRQEAFCEIGKAEDFIIEMTVDEVDITSINIGQLVLMDLEAYPDSIFRARVTKIYPTKNIRTQSFKIEAQFEESPSRLYSGLSGEANIITDTKNRVLTIPLEYLTQDNHVLNQQGHKLLLELGERNMDRVEILGGIDSSMLIRKP